jgi:hypothetical protein
MHGVQPQIPSAAVRVRYGDGRQRVIRLIIGLATLYLIGAAVAVFVVRDQTPTTPARKVYPPDLVYDGVLAYDLTDPAPTAYGSFTADAVHLDESGTLTEVTLSLTVDNHRDSPIDLPRLDDLRVVNTDGAEATYLGGGWHDSMVRARSSSSGEFRFAAPPAGGMLILEYREGIDGTPVRFAVGYALQRSAL